MNYGLSQNLLGAMSGVGYGGYANPMMGGMMNPMMGGYMNPMMGGMMNPYMSGLNFTGREDMNNYMNARMDDWKSGMMASGQTRISQKAVKMATRLNGALANGKDTEVGIYLKQLEENPELMAGVELAYDQMAGQRTAFRQELRNQLGGHKLGLGISQTWHNITSSVARAFGYDPISENDAIDIVNQGALVNTTVAANAMKDATLGWGTDEKTVDFILENHKGRMNEIESSYQQMGSYMMSDVRGDYHGIVDGFGKREAIASQLAESLFQ